MNNKSSSCGQVHGVVGRIYRDENNFINLNITGIPGMEKLVLGNLLPMADCDRDATCHFCNGPLFATERRYGEDATAESFETGDELVCKNCGVVKRAEANKDEEYCNFRNLESPEAYVWCDYRLTSEPGVFLVHMVTLCDKETVLEYLRFCTKDNGFSLEDIENVIFSPCLPPNTSNKPPAAY